MKEIIKKAVIPVAGFGTRLLPATKSQPKEMLPIVDKPAVQYVVEEAIKSGAENILFITGRGKRAIEDYFDYAVELEKELEDKGKTDLLDEVRNISEMAKFFYVRQKIARGLGDAIYHARGFIDDEYFSVLLADDIIDSEIPCLKQMINVFRNYRGMILAVMEVPEIRQTFTVLLTVRKFLIEFMKSPTLLKNQNLKKLYLTLQLLDDISLTQIFSMQLKKQNLVREEKSRLQMQLKV